VPVQALLGRVFLASESARENRKPAPDGEMQSAEKVQKWTSDNSPAFQRRERCASTEESRRDDWNITHPWSISPNKKPRAPDSACSRPITRN